MTLATMWPSTHFTLSGDRVRRTWSPWPSGIRRYLHEPEMYLPDEWRASALQHLRELASLAPGWDEVSAPAIDPSLVNAVSRFISSALVLDLDSKPDIVPTFAGGLLIEWHTAAVDLIIDIAPADEPSFYFFDNETGEEVEATLGQRADALTSAFVKLSRPQ